MGKVIRAPRAKTELLRIGRYIARSNLSAAPHFLDKVDEALTQLARFPGLEPSRDELSRGLRSFPVGNYILFYRVLRDGIQLLRVIDGRQDLPPKFQK